MISGEHKLSTDEKIQWGRFVKNSLGSNDYKLICKEVVKYIAKENSYFVKTPSQLALTLTFVSNSINFSVYFYSNFRLNIGFVGSKQLEKERVCFQDIGVGCQ